MEALAGKYLQRQGLKVIEKNFYSRKGEIDLICRDGETLVFVEVRYRREGSLTSAAESISTTKQQRIIQTAHYYLQKKKCWHLPCRFDAVLIADCDSKQRYQFDWIANAFSGIC